MKDKRAIGRILFDADYTQTDIARVLQLSPTTVVKWAKIDNWRANRLKHSLERETSEENALTALAFQTKIIRLIAQRKEEDLKDGMNAEDLAKLLIPKGEIDAVQKLFTTVKGKELDWSAMVKILRNFMAYLKDVDLELSKELLPYADDYINLKRRSS